MKEKDIKKSGGVFWLIEDYILAVPYCEGTVAGVAKSGKNYNHRLLWDYVKPKRCNKPFNYYPRGRVEIDNRDRAVAFMSPHIGEDYIEEIAAAFKLERIDKIHYDGSRHYKCIYDDEL